jgi:hypothetical protein
MIAQAEHIPVHLGAMPDAVAAVREHDPTPDDVWTLGPGGCQAPARRPRHVNDPLRRRNAPPGHHARHPHPRRFRGHTRATRVTEREQQAHGDGLDFPVELRRRLERERLDDAVGPDPLAHAERALKRDERLRVRRAEPVEVCPVLPPQCSRCSNPAVATKAVRAPLHSRSAFVATVVPWVSARRPPRPRPRRPRAPTRPAAPRSDLGGAEAVLGKQYRVGEGPSHVDAEHAHACRHADPDARDLRRADGVEGDQVAERSDSTATNSSPSTWRPSSASSGTSGATRA